MATSLTLYGVPLSQPTRAVAWALLQKRVPFQFQLVVPGSSHKTRGSRGEDFLARTGGRTARIPLLADGDTVIFESPVILKHLCQSRGWKDLYPDNRLLLESYLHWHHEGTRRVSALVQNVLRPDLHIEMTPDRVEGIHQVLHNLDTAWLVGGNYLAGTSTPTIADLLAYEEIFQIRALGCWDLAPYTNLVTWCEQMKTALDYHEEVHRAVSHFAANDTLALPLRLGAATQAGILAIQEAQNAYNSI